jgi:hypothetical protein
METAADKIVLAFFLVVAAAGVYFVVRPVKPRTPGKEAPVPLGFQERQRMDLQEFYETYYLKPGSPIRMNQVQAGLGLFSMQAHVPMELLRPTDRLADFGQRSDGFFTSILTIPLQQAIARNPKLAGCKMETVDDLIQLSCKAEDEEPPKA